MSPESIVRRDISPLPSLPSRKEQDHKAMADRLSLVEKELRESEDQRRRQKSELSAMQVRF
jgi:hypothetical protein